jgi:hypothetical protein
VCLAEQAENHLLEVTDTVVSEQDGFVASELCQTQQGHNIEGKHLPRNTIIQQNPSRPGIHDSEKMRRKERNGMELTIIDSDKDDTDHSLAARFTLEKL